MPATVEGLLRAGEQSGLPESLESVVRTLERDNEIRSACRSPSAARVRPPRAPSRGPVRQIPTDIEAMTARECNPDYGASITCYLTDGPAEGGPAQDGSDEAAEVSVQILDASGAVIRDLNAPARRHLIQFFCHRRQQVVL